MMLFVACMASWATAATKIDGIYYSFSGSGSNRKATVTYETSSYNSYSGDVVIPSTVYYDNYNYPVTNIGMHAFELCTGLTSVTIPSSVIAIEMYAFKDCTGLTSIDIPSSVTSLGGNVFLDCTGLTEINGQSSVNTISSSVFKGCTNLETITVLGNITEIPMSAFEGCSSLTSMAIPNSVTAIRGTAFKGCTGLTSITIPSSVTTIGGNAFQGCTGVTEINYNVTTHSDFSSSTLPFKGCTSSNITVNIGFNVTTIPAYVFSGLNVTEITIPSSVTSIGNNAFGNYTKLSTVYMLCATPPTLANNYIFKSGYNTYSNIKVLYSSDHSILTAYQEATNWSDFSSSISETDNVTIANMDLTNGSLTIPSGNTISVTRTLTNTDASHLIIEDGGQLITTSNSVKAKVKKTTNASSAKAVNNWYVISSPVNDVTIASIVGESTHNVYRYDEEEVQWEEYRDGHNPFSTLANGRGYLYRSTAAGIDFIGDVNVEDAEYELTYTPTVGDYAGFHLIGNPFTHNIYKGANGAIENDYLEDGFYTLSAACAWVAGTDNTDAIAPTQAILVQAKSTADGETLEITNTTAGGPTKYGNNQIMFAVKNAEYSDVAYVLFKEGHGLNKVEHRNAEIPMLYVINNGEEFAIADMSDNTGVINLGFEAKTMGQYTISLKAEGQYSYMHLIDKLTGEDTDMLVEDSYTFVGSQSDRNDRFVLRLNYNAAGIDSESDIFAYQNGNDIIVRGEGTLQVFDITGRMVMSTRIDGVETINGIESGVYIFRMEGKTQKIVVR